MAAKSAARNDNAPDSPRKMTAIGDLYRPGGLR
jgi:hypothetical protein